MRNSSDKHSLTLSLEQIGELDSQAIADAVFCDLFLNYELPIEDVANVANLSHETVTETLLKLGIVRDRRRSEKQPADGIGRRKTKAVSVFPGCFLSPHSLRRRPSLREYCEFCRTSP